MTSPYNNLKKNKKMPLPGQRAAPYRSVPVTGDTILDEMLQRLELQEKSGVYIEDASGSNKKTQTGRKNSAPVVPTDMDLMSGMMSKISQLELQVKYYTKEIIDKDKKINVLEEKVNLLQRYKGTGCNEESGTRSHKVEELERKCQKLEIELQDIQEFLEDYGMVWVGDDDDVYEELNETEKPTVGNPASLASDQNQKVDFDRVIENIKELNVIAGEGLKEIKHTSGGARLHTKEQVPLTLYANGIFMFNGPFRCYDEPSTKACIQDFTDGYFPSELKKRYPDGTPFLVKDKREVFYQDPRRKENFPGSGQTLGGDKVPSKLVPTNLNRGTSMTHHQNVVSLTDDFTGLKLSKDQFLNKLPQSVVRNGKVIDVRSSIGNQLSSTNSKAHITVIDTPIVKSIKERVNRHPSANAKTTRSSTRPLSARNVATLRVKSEAGNETYVLKLGYGDTIGDVRKYIDEHRSMGNIEYEILTTFPRRTYSDPLATLEQCGLTPNATVILRTKKL
ncbi:UBX domain-containing protein 11-like isoform X2 [Antedon mediterranea]|uniref:UBX domain-containing protein 11-like isoform X2 n=1 Tax=Antedon mediterranea TaxID=105859 RepID=UPI003AF7D8EF